jgi:hypothetical protein
VSVVHNYLLTLCAAIGLAACSSAPRTPESSDAELGNWVSRICALPPAERMAEIARVKEKEGITIFCPDRKAEPKPANQTP